MKWFLTGLVTLFIGSTATAESVYVMKPKGSGVDQGNLDAIHELIRDAVMNLEGFELVEDQGGAKIILKAKALRLGESYILAIVKYVDRKKVFSNKMKASNLDDMDTVAGRVVRAVLTEVQAKKDARVSDVTQDEETRGTRRKKAVRQWEIGFGPAWLGNLNTDTSGINWKFGYLWAIDDRIDLKLSWEFLTTKEDDDANFTDIHLGMNYFFNDGNNAPYLTADVGYGAATAHEENNNQLFGSDDDASGFTIGAGVGMKFLRVSTVNVSLQLRYAMVMEKTEHTKKKPNVTSLVLSVYF